MSRSWVELWMCKRVCVIFSPRLQATAWYVKVHVQVLSAVSDDWVTTSKLCRWLYLIALLPLLKQNPALKTPSIFMVVVPASLWCLPECGIASHSIQKWDSAVGKIRCQLQNLITRGANYSLCKYHKAMFCWFLEQINTSFQHPYVLSPLVSHHSWMPASLWGLLLSWVLLLRQRESTVKFSFHQKQEVHLPLPVNK